LESLVWIGSSKKDLDNLPEVIGQEFGYGLYLTQNGEKHTNSKPLKGFGSANILELIEKDESGTYRAVYTIQMKDVVFVLHVFQKKSKHGIETPKQDIELIKNRLKQAQELYKKRSKS
jgi:phage-related protein